MATTHSPKAIIPGAFPSTHSLERFHSIRSYTKPLPALPNDPSSVPAIPRLLTDDLPLDNRSLAHLRAMVRQALDSVYLKHDPWESVVITIVLDIAEQIPSVLETLATQERLERRLAAQEAKERENAEKAISASSQQNQSAGSSTGLLGATKAILNLSSVLSTTTVMTPAVTAAAAAKTVTAPTSLPVKYCIMLTKEESANANPHGSYYVYNQFKGVSLLQGPDGDQLDHSKYRYLGGTIVLKGTSSDLAKVARIFELLVFVVCNLKLEMAVMRDHHVMRETQDKRIEERYKIEAEEVHNTVRQAKKTSHKGVFGWLMKQNKRISRFGNTSSRHSKPIPALSTPVFMPGSWDPTPPETPGASSLNVTVAEEPESYNGSHRFADIICKMESSVISSSPDVVYPPPHLLVRLKEEEDHVNSFDEASFHKEDRNLRALFSPDAASSTNFASANTWTRSLNPQTARTLPQHILAYSTLRSNDAGMIDARTGLSYLATNTRTIDGLVRHQSLSYSYSCFWSPTSPVACESPHVVTIDFYRRYPPSTPTIDHTLGEMIEDWCRNAHRSCNGHPSCGRERIRHIMTFTHGTGRINVVVDEAVGAAEDEAELTKKKEEAQDERGREEAERSLSEMRDAIVMWTECKLCQSRTPPLRMSDATYRYSFGKYLELLFYNPRFVPPTGLCPHAQDGRREEFMRCFQHNGLVVWFEYEPIDLFEMRMPRLQPVPVAEKIEESGSGMWFRGSKRKSGSVTKDGVLDEMGVGGGASSVDVTEDKEKVEATDQIRKEITHFYGSVRKHVNMLDGYIASEEKFFANHVGKPKTESMAEMTEKESENPAASAPETLGIREELAKMAEEFDRERDVLTEALERSGGECLNDVRRAFAKRVEATKEMLNLWQKEKCHELDADAPWVEPEYVSNKKLHLFPGSSIIVREEEPSSIIAYALSSKDYFRELAYLQNPLPSPSTQGGSDYGFPSIRPALASPAASLRNFMPQHSPGLDGDDSDGDDGYLLLDEYYTVIRRISHRDASAPYAGSSFGNLKGLTALGGFGGTSSKKTSPNSSAAVSRKTTREDHNGEGEDVTSEGEGEKNNGKDAMSGIPPVINGLFNSGLTDTPGAAEEVSTPTLGANMSDERSLHIKYKFTHGKIRFTCTIYYAAQFDALRRQCGIDKLYLQSLSRCISWNVSGGKSKSIFFKTQDDRLVLKQMVSSWNIAEKDALLKFAPKYFEYMDKSAESPSVLAKIFGFYTIKMKDLRQKHTAMRMDILVMEQLFFAQKITRKFDLKGIQDRHVKETKVSRDDTTLWDGDWVEEFKTLLLIYSHSKRIIRESIRNDTQFLADANIMDYSLLVGVDDERRELVVGIVDFIGAFTWYKKIESKGKSTLQRHKEVTVLPPEQYKARFRDAMEQYFLAVPDKWVKPVSEIPSSSSIPPMPPLPPQTKSPGALTGFRNSKVTPNIALTASTPTSTETPSVFSIFNPTSVEKESPGTSQVLRLPSVL